MNALKFASLIGLLALPGINSFAQDNSPTSLDWPGHYSTGKNMHLELRADQTYTLTNGGQRTSGKFNWNGAGSMITLPKNKLSFRVGENHLTGTRYGTRLEKLGGPESAPMAVVDEESLYGGKWVLIELNGKPVSEYSKLAKSAFLAFDQKEMRFDGSGGCNGFGGTFEVNAATGRIRFGQTMSTMKACIADGTDAEPLLLNALRTADNYTIHNGVLSLNKARMAPLARFQMIVK